MFIDFAIIFVARSCKTTKVVIAGGFKFLNIDLDCQSAMGSKCFDRVKFVKCVQERFLRQYGATLQGKGQNLIYFEEVGKDK